MRACKFNFGDLFQFKVFLEGEITLNNENMYFFDIFFLVDGFWRPAD